MTDQKRIRYCDVCRGVRKNTDCGTCEYGTPPPLMPENEDALALWVEARTQFRSSGMGLIGLDYKAIREEADDMGLSFTGSLKKKIKALEHHTLMKQAESATSQTRSIKPGLKQKTERPEDARR